MDATYRRIPWTDGVWSNEPEFVKEEQGALRVGAKEGSDYWEKTLYQFVHKDGHCLLADWKPEEAMEVTFSMEGFTELYDQAGLMLWHDETHWIKASVEVTDGAPGISVVVTDGYSDWSAFPVPDWAGAMVTVRASLFEDAVLIRMRTDTLPWRTVRMARFPYQSGNKAGPLICAPTRAGFSAVFTRWLATVPDKALHEDPDIIE